ncbi:MAG: 4-coumarate--CoA ligase [Spirochaetia bacterium]
MVLRQDILERVLQDLVVAELSESQRDKATAPDEHALTPHDESLDSFELYTVAAAVSIMFHVHETGLEDLLLARPRPQDWVEIVQRSLNASGKHISFRSSGSTGGKTLHQHNMSDLLREVEFFISALRRPTRIISTIPSHHIYGFLFTALLPSRLDIPIIDARGPAAVTRKYTAGDLLVSFPFALERMLHFGSMPGEGVTILCSTAPCPPELAAAIRSTGAELVEIYGSSETAGVGIRRADGEPYSLMPYLSRADTSDPSALVLCDAPASEQGQAPQTERVLHMPDEVEWSGRRSFRPLRRRDGAVQVGGVNVYPDEVCEHIKRHPMVATAAVRTHKTKDGVRLKAFVVPRAATGNSTTHQPADSSDIEQQLREKLSAKLEAAARPIIYTFGTKLPRNELGKLRDWQV